MYLFLKTMLIGLSIAAPVGPIGLLCIERTLRRGQAIGIATGLGAACADAAYGAIGILGITAVMSMLTQMKSTLSLIGALFLVYLAYRTWISASAPKAAQAGGGESMYSSFFGTFMLTLSNPMTILSFIAIFAALAPSGNIGWQEKIIMVSGVFLGSALWWFFLVFSVSRLSAFLSPTIHLWIRRSSALLLFGFGAWQAAQLA